MGLSGYGCWYVYDKDENVLNNRCGGTALFLCNGGGHQDVGIAGMVTDGRE